MAAIISRSQWGPRYRNGVGTRPVGSLEKYLHHTVTAHLSANATRAQEEAQMRVLERIGQERFGGGISYPIVIFPSGRIYMGASIDRITYHSGSGRNTRGVGIALAGNFEANKLNMRVFNAVVWLLQEGVRRGWWGDPALTSYHKQFRATSCPGKHAISRFADMNTAGRGGKISAPSPVTGTAPRDTSKRVEIDTLMQTAQRNVELKSHRRSDDDSVITATLGSKGWRLHVLYREGTWARVQRNGLHWVPWAHLEPYESDWPNEDLPVTDKHTSASHNAWVKLMADVGYKQPKLGLALQKWLSDLGYYKGLHDGYFGPRSVKALQNFLKDKGLYKGIIDGKRLAWTVNAEIEYLNSQRQHY